MNKLIMYWHSILDMPKHDLAWHEQDISDELVEFTEARGLVPRWSELSDLVYTCTRAQWSGHTDIHFPFGAVSFFLGSVYMIPKYTFRWRFFRTLGKRFDKRLKISEVRNPEKTAKLEVIAKQYGLDPDNFTYEAKKLLKHWILLK